MYVRSGEEFAAQGEEFGGGFAVGPGIGDQDPFVRLPLLAYSREVARSGVGPHAQPDQFLVAGQHLESSSGRPEHAIGVAERQGVSGELGRCGDRQQHQIRRDPLGIGPQVTRAGERHVADHRHGRAQCVERLRRRLHPSTGQPLVHEVGVGHHGGVER